MPFEIEGFKDTIIFADFEKKILIGKCKAKDFKRPKVRSGDSVTIHLQEV